MRIMHRGHVLTQKQLDAIAPLVNESMSTDMSISEFQRRIDVELEKAGCPVNADPLQEQEGAGQ